MTNPLAFIAVQMAHDPDIKRAALDTAAGGGSVTAGFMNATGNETVDAVVIFSGVLIVVFRLIASGLDAGMKVHAIIRQAMGKGREG